MTETTESSTKTLLIETFEGPGSEGSYYTGKNNGIFYTLEGLSSEIASLSIHGTTIAAHVDHIRYYLWVIRTMVKEDRIEKDWNASWKISHVNEAEWADIRNRLKEEYTTLLKELDSINMKEWGTNVIGTVVHTAYHLGAIRQMLKVIEKK